MGSPPTGSNPPMGRLEVGTKSPKQLGIMNIKKTPMTLDINSIFSISFRYLTLRNGHLSGL